MVENTKSYVTEGSSVGFSCRSKAEQVSVVNYKPSDSSNWQTWLSRPQVAQFGLLEGLMAYEIEELAMGLYDRMKPSCGCLLLSLYFSSRALLSPLNREPTHQSVTFKHLTVLYRISSSELIDTVFQKYISVAFAAQDVLFVCLLAAALINDLSGKAKGKLSTAMII